MLPIRPPLSGLWLMLFAMACFSVMNTIISAMAGELPSPVMVTVRNGFSFLFMLPFAVAGGPEFLKTQRLRDHALRSVIGILSMETWFYAVTLLPVTQAIALSFTTPIFVTIYAMLFLNENVGLRRWSAIFCGFAGALIIIRPGLSPVGSASLIVLASSALTAFSGIVVKTLTRTERPALIVFYMTVFMSLLSLPLGIAFWQTPTLRQLGMLAAIALVSTLAQLALAHAYMRAEMATLMPLDFTRLLFTAVIAYLWFGEVLDGPTLAGAALIAVSTLYIAYRERQLRRERNRFDESLANG